ncbi:uncharacterized protein LOC132550061 [Ylistrum balloti]|uniref:uncharacterized protein LOC132550061 n=1 Tax=Ylistrum balloti TaxID=509963 RepID=UPI0029058F43|nr:uncharacterized protein LOC132550061 [Ylistrum balloti]
MAFSTTYHHIINHDLKNIYAGNSGSRMQRPQAKLPVIPQHRYKHRTDPQTLVGFEYNLEYRVYVPRAPAFDILSKKYINKMVNRMSKPTKRKSLADDALPRHLAPEFTLNRSVTSFSSADIKRCSERLANQQTVATEVRNCLTKCTKSKSEPPDMKLSCPRMTMSISQRYYPRAYKNWNPSQQV